MKIGELLRSRFLRGVAVGVGITLLAAVVGVGWVRSRALSSECADLRREDLSIDEMIAIKRRVDDYRRDPSRPLELSGREASFLVREHLRMQAWLGVSGDQIELDLRIPTRERCYDVAFLGTLEVVDGVAHLVPTSFVVGRLDLSWWAGGSAYEIGSGQVSEPGAARLLAHVTSLKVAQGRIAIEVDDPEILK